MLFNKVLKYGGIGVSCAKTSSGNIHLKRASYISAFTENTLEQYTLVEKMLFMVF